MRPQVSRDNKLQLPTNHFAHAAAAVALAAAAHVAAGRLPKLPRPREMQLRRHRGLREVEREVPEEVQEGPPQEGAAVPEDLL